MDSFSAFLKGVSPRYLEIFLKTKNIAFQVDKDKNKKDIFSEFQKYFWDELKQEQRDEIARALPQRRQGPRVLCHGGLDSVRSNR